MYNAPNKPYHLKVQKKHLTEKELEAPVDVVMIVVRGSYTARGEHRKEIVEKSFEAEIEVPKNFNLGHVKLCSNNYVKKKLNGIRVRQFYVDDSKKPKKLDHKRMVRDFMSEQGLRDNERLRREYKREIDRVQAEQNAFEGGDVPPGVLDESDYGIDGLPRYSDRVYSVKE